MAAQCYQEEEDRELAEAIEATGMTIFPEDLFFRRQRMLSLGEMSAPPDFHGSCRFSSVGGYFCINKAFCEEEIFCYYDISHLLSFHYSV